MSRISASPVSPPTRSHARRARLLPVAAFATGVLVLAGCGGDDKPEEKPPATPAAAASFNVTSALAGAIPENAVAFAEVSIRPNADATAAIDELGKAFGVDDVGGELAKELDLDDDGDLPKGMTFEKDVLPHLGDHVGGFAVLPADATAKSSSKDAEIDGAVVASVKDSAALRKALEPSVAKDTKKVTVAGQEVYRDPNDDIEIWFGDKNVVVGTQAAVAAAIGVSTGGSLSDNKRFTTALGQVRATDPMAVGWGDFQHASQLSKALASLSSESEDVDKALSGLSGSAAKPGMSKRSPNPLDSLGTTEIPDVDATVAFAVLPKPGQLRIETGGTLPKPEDGQTSTAGKDSAAAVAALPAGSWAAFGSSGDELTSAQNGVEDPFTQLEELSGEKLPKGLKDVVKSVKTVAVGVRGDSLLGLGGAATLRATDPAAATKMFELLKKELRGADGIKVADEAIPGAEQGFTGSTSELPIKLAAGLKGDVVAFGLGVASVTAALEVKTPLSGDAAYKQAKDALGGDAPSFLIDPKPLSQLLGDLPSDDDLDEIVTATRAVKLIAASRVDTGPTTWRGALVINYDAQAASAAKGGGTTGTTTSR